MLTNFVKISDQKFSHLIFSIQTMWLKFSVLSLIFIVTYQQIQYDASKFDNDLFQIFTNLVAKESKLSEMMLKIVPTINSTSDSLSSFPRYISLVTALNNLEAVLIRQSSLNNFRPYENISTCSDVNIKITTLEFDIKQYYSLWAKAATNLTEMSRFNALVTHYYAVNLYYLGVGSTVQVTINSVIALVNKVIVEYYR